MKRLWPLFSLLILPACSGSLDVGSDGQPKKSSGDAPAESSGSDPRATCVQLRDEPVALAELPGTTMLRPIADGTKVWFAAYDSVSTSQAPAAKIWQVDLATHTSTALSLDGFTGGLFSIVGNELAYVRTETKESSVLVLRDRETSAERVLPNPTGTTMVSALRGHTSGLYWASRSMAGDGPIAISRFVQGATYPTELAIIRNHSALATDGQRVFYVRHADGSSAVHISAVPIDGSTEPAPFVTGFDATKEYVQVFAVDANEVFYTVSRLENGGTIREGDIRATTKDGKTTRTVATGQTFGGITDVNVNVTADSFIWVDGSASADIVHVKRAGGVVERFAGKTPTRYVNGVTADACNVYWTVVNPPALYGRSRFP